MEPTEDVLFARGSGRESRDGGELRRRSFSFAAEEPIPLP
jgi:hypothetical protein